MVEVSSNIINNILTFGINTNIINNILTFEINTNIINNISFVCKYVNIILFCALQYFLSCRRNLLKIHLHKLSPRSGLVKHIWLHQHKYINTNPSTQIHQHKYINTNKSTQTQIHKWEGDALLFVNTVDIINTLSSVNTIPPPITVIVITILADRFQLSFLKMAS